MRNIKKIKELINSSKNKNLILSGLIGLAFLYFELFAFGVYQAIRSPLSSRIAFGVLRLLKLAFKESKVFLLIAAALSIVLIFICYVVLSKKSPQDPRGLILSKSKSGGVGRMMDFDEKNGEFNLTDFYKPQGVILGEDKKSHLLITVPFEGEKAPTNGNFLVVGKSGSRKTSAVLIPNIFSAMQSGCSVICTDPKGEIYSTTAPLAYAKGINVRVLNIMPGQFSHSDGWDLLKFVREAQDPASMASLVVDIISKNLGGAEAGDFWEMANKNLLETIILAVAVATDYEPITSTDNKSKGRNMKEVYALLSSANMESKLKTLIAASDFNEKLLSSSFYSWSQHAQHDSIKAGLATKMSIFQSESLSRVLSEDEIDFKEINEKQTALYIICSDKDGTYQCILALISALLFYQLTDIADKSKEKHLKRPVYFFFEEFKNIGYIPDLSKKISTLRSRHINMVFCYQNIDQLRDTYSTKGERNEYQTIIANCALMVCCGSGDSETDKFFSNRSGEMTIDDKSVTIRTRTFGPEALKFNPEGNIRTQGKGRAVLLESEISKIKTDEILIIKQGANPIVEKKYFYKHHPLYQYQAVNSDGEMTVLSHLSHVPDWAWKDKEKEASLVTGVRPKRPSNIPRVAKFDGLHLRQKMLEMEEEESSRQSAWDFLFETEKPKEGSSSKRLDYFIRDKGDS